MKVYAARSFVRDPNKLKDARLRKRIDTALCTLAAAESLSNLTNIKAMEGASNAYRLRVGDYRLGFVLQDDEVILRAVCTDATSTGAFLSKPQQREAEASRISLIASL